MQAAQLISNSSITFANKMQVLQPRPYAALLSMIRGDELRCSNRSAFFGRAVAAVGNVSYICPSWD